jgi:hypothetical protein
MSVAVTLSVIMLSVIMLRVIMLNVMAPEKGTFNKKCCQNVLILWVAPFCPCLSDIVSFVLMLPFEMRTVLYGICLFNDARHKHGSNIYMKWKEGGREQDSGETEKERV